MTRIEKTIKAVSDLRGFYVRVRRARRQARTGAAAGAQCDADGAEHRRGEGAEGGGSRLRKAGSTRGKMSSGGAKADVP
jgi:hypothetical protein